MMYVCGVSASTPPEHVRPIEVNVGGIVPHEDLVGRDAELDRLMGLVAPPAHGAMLLGDRRIGKTSLLRTVEQPLREAGHLVVRVSAETSSMDDFARALQAGLMVEPRLGSWGIDLEGEAAVRVGIAQVSLRARAQRGAGSRECDLFATCARAARAQGPHQRVVFLLDEITVLATELARESPGDARDFLRMLRRARQEFSEVVMVLAGSIGLHHALPDSTEVNDLVEMPVDVLEQPAAMRLAEGLILGAGLTVTEPRAVASAMVAHTSGFPFYLHGTAQLLSERRGVVDPGAVAQEVRRALDLDLWNTQHYDSRLDDYYRGDAELVRDVLDAIATAAHPMSVDEILQTATVAVHVPTRTRMLTLLQRLERDHYLRRAGQRTAMANGLIGRIWRHVRRL